MKPTYRVIFDRSSFHGNAFAKLLSSPLQSLCDRGDFQVYHTPVFFEETLGSFGASRATDWQAHLKFAVEICNGGVFLEKDEIWHNELVSGQGVLARYLLPERPTRRYDYRARLLATLAEKARTGDLVKEWKGSRAERDTTFSKNRRQRATALGMREEISKAMRKGNVIGKLSDASFSRFLPVVRIPLGRELMRLVTGSRVERLADTWASNPQCYPFYSAFIDGLSYSLFRATAEHQKPIDRNAQADYEQLAYLNWADVVVTNEQKFLRDAFNAIWRHRGKRLETTESFVDLVNRLS